MNPNSLDRRNERGAALATVVLISVLLLTACIALLHAVGANSANSADVLSETKAYYAAETGLQATINELRYDCSATYSAAKADPDMSSWLPYDVTTPYGTSAVVIGQTSSAYNANPRLGSAYAIEVSDPDNIGNSTTYSTQAGFLSTVLVGNTVVDISSKCSGVNCSTVTYGDPAGNFTSVSLVNPVTTPSTIDFSTASSQNVPLITFQVAVGGTGGPIDPTHVVRFELRYSMSWPRQESKTIGGSISQAATAGSPIVVKFNAKEHSLMGSYINVCDLSVGCAVTIDPCVARSHQIFTVSLPAANGEKLISANVTPVQPTRMLIRSTGYGPQRSKKILEAIVQRNFFDNLGSTPAIAMLGPTGPGFVFQPGTSSGVTYSGGSGPSFGVTDPTILQYMLTHPPGPSGGSMTQMQPPPAMMTDVPSWQQSAEALHAKVLEYKLAAQGSGTYYTGGGTLPFAPGNHTTGTGITFCEGNCQVGADGGGILVVTGTLTNVGDFDFRGLILVTGPGGWQRNGGGNGLVEGSIVIAPYDPNNLAAGFLPPRYQVTGGGNSDVAFTELSTAFDGNVAATDFVLGVAEK